MYCKCGGSALRKASASRIIDFIVAAHAHGDDQHFNALAIHAVDDAGLASVDAAAACQRFT